MKNRSSQRHLVNTRYVNKLDPLLRYTNAHREYLLDIDIAYFDDQMIIKDHAWLSDIKEMAKVLNSTDRLPHFSRSADGALVTSCDECRRMYRMRREFILLKEKV